MQGGGQGSGGGELWSFTPGGLQPGKKLTSLQSTFWPLGSKPMLPCFLSMLLIICFQSLFEEMRARKLGEGVGAS